MRDEHVAYYTPHELRYDRLVRARTKQAMVEGWSPLLRANHYAGGVGQGGARLF